MVAFSILAGGFTSFIATYVFDSDAGTLALTQQNPTGDGPSWLVTPKDDTSILYATNEVTEGAIQSFTVNKDDGTLTLKDTVSTGGNGPTFASVLSTGEVTGMNYGGANAMFAATTAGDPLTFTKDSPVIAFNDGGPSNPHMSLEYKGEVFVPDLGADKIWRLSSTGTPGNWEIKGKIDIDAGAGPRHIAIKDDILFTLHEHTSALTAQYIPATPDAATLPLIANVSIVPADQPAGTSFAAAEILISEPTDAFPEGLIYVSNRNIGATIVEAGDNIAIFRYNGPSGNSTSTPTSKRMVKQRRQEAEVDILELVAQVPTGLQQIRGMQLGSVTGKSDEFLVAGANTDGGVAVFKRTEKGANLELVARNTELASRTSFVWI